MSVRLSEIIKEFKIISTNHPQIQSFGAGPLYDLQDDIKYYPYLWIQTDEPHSVLYNEDNGYRVIELTFGVRVGDKINNQPGYLGQLGIGSNNGLDISSDTFNIVLDIINTISESATGYFTQLQLVDDITIEPFFNSEGANVNGWVAFITLRAKNEGVCFNPLTD